MNCPVCNSMNVTEVYERDNMPFGFFIPDGSNPVVFDLKISLCRECLFAFQESAYNSPEYDQKFDEIYKNYRIMDKNLTPFPYEHGFSETMDFLTKDIEFSGINDVLEIGSNRGDLLYLLRQRHGHLNVIGLEPSRLDFVGVITVRYNFKPDLFSNKFDLIIMRHVLEHVKYPLKFLFDIKNCLSEGGLVFIEVPNLIRDLSDKIECFTPDHVNYFSAPAFMDISMRTQMNIRAIKDDPDSHLMVILENSGIMELKQGLCDISAKGNLLLNKLDAYCRELDEMTKAIIDLVTKDGFKIIFYGSGNAFMWSFSKLKSGFESAHHDIMDHVLFCLDDSPSKAGKLMFNGIKIYDPSQMENINHDRVLAVLCSLNRGFIGKMRQRIKEVNNTSISDLRIFEPWKEMIRIR